MIFPIEIDEAIEAIEDSIKILQLIINDHLKQDFLTEFLRYIIKTSETQINEIRQFINNHTD